MSRYQQQQEAWPFALKSANACKHLVRAETVWEEHDGRGMLG